MTFEKKRLNEIGTIVGGGTPPTREPSYWNGPVAWLTPKDMASFEGVYVSAGSRSLTLAGLKKSSAKVLPKGSVLYTSRAPIGYIAIAASEIATNQGFKSLILKSDYIPEFIYYLLKASKAEIESHASGGTFAEISATAFGNVELGIPPKPIQRTISSILSVLDEKITHNRRKAETLEAIAQTIFKSWFIDFDPVRAKMAGEELVGMDAETAALFPDSMEESELGMIPSGWTLSNIRGICDKIINGSTPLRSNKDFWGRPDLKWFKTGELADGFLLDSKEHISSLALERTSVKVLPKGAVLMAIYAAPTVGRLGILTSDATFNQACTGMLAQKKYGLEFLYLNLLFLRKFFNSRAIGAAQQNISKVVVEEAPVLLGSDQLHLAFSKLISPIFAQIESLTQQNRTLAEIRDALLPRLISGELQIPDEMLES